MVLLSDNYDSFTYNLYQYLCELGADALERVIGAFEARFGERAKLVVKFPEFGQLAGGDDESHVPRTRASADAIEAGLEVAFALQPDHLVHHLALVEHQHRRDGADAVLAGQTGMVVDVDLADPGLVGIFAGNFVDQGAEHFARAAPLGPKIHEHGHGGEKDFGFKIFLG